MKNNQEITGRNFEYKMDRNMMMSILALESRKGFKGSTQDFLCKYVNEDLGIMGTCTKVITW